MASLSWCKKQKKGMKFIKPNDNLAKEYFKNAEETLDILREIKGKSNMWLATTKYYCEYFAVYSILMKIGIKCEIHECTISIVSILEEKGLFRKGTTKILEKDKELRIDNQYYLKNKKMIISYSELLEFLLEIKEILNTLSEEKIHRIRNFLKKKS
jgi:uncharacterized protein (UPF0332 family)